MKFRAEQVFLLPGTLKIVPTNQLTSTLHTVMQLGMYYKGSSIKYGLSVTF